MSIGLLAFLLIGGLFFGFVLSRLLKLQLSNAQAKVDQLFADQTQMSPTPFTASLPAPALEPVSVAYSDDSAVLSAAPDVPATPRELVAASLVFPNDYDHRVAVIRVNLLHNDIVIATYSLIAMSKVTTIAASLIGAIADAELPADVTLQAHAIANREELDMRDCLVDIRPGDFYAEAVVLINADGPAEISVNMQRLPA